MTAGTPSACRATEAAVTVQQLSFVTVLRACLLAGLVAGVASAIVSLAVVEPAMAPALEIEGARSSVGHHHADEGAVVSRPVQVVGGVVVAIAAGVTFGALYAVAFGLLRRRLAGRTDFGRAIVLAVIGWAVLALLPAVKIPANPPAVGDPETVGTRSAIYAGVLLAGVVIALLGYLAHGGLSARGMDLPARTTGTVIVVSVLVVLALAVIPWTPDSIPPDVPAAVVWNFRLASLAQLTTLWAVLGLSAGWLLSRAVTAQDARNGDTVSAAA